MFFIYYFFVHAAYTLYVKLLFAYKSKFMVVVWTGPILD